MTLPAADEEKLDPAVVADLYLRHGDELRHFLVGVLRDGQLANDVLQNTLIRLMECGGQTKQESRKAWLFRVAYNEAMWLRRRGGTGRKIHQKVAWSADVEDHSSPDQAMIRFETVAALQEALAELPEDQRRVVQMRIYQEKTFAVIAEELGIPLGTALARMRSALVKLRRRLDQERFGA